MRGVLVDDHEPVAGLRHDVGLVQLRARSAERPVDLIGGGLEARNRRIRGRLADIEGSLRGFRKARAAAPPRIGAKPAGRAGERRQS